MNQDKEEPNQPNQTLLKINVILGWISAGGDITNNKRKYVFITAQQQSPWNKPFISIIEDEEGATYPIKMPWSSPWSSLTTGTM